ncbi:unnamed protein product [Clonostachys rhizophaga]|uniref:Uncharacterized protein n=1 Tax=Clonostachys rhizophaga TaxID=160324 RepID=A0A9N9Z9J5_9HYPO|nr:unnamed protein product [Clonostachys rhizophaga]
MVGSMNPTAPGGAARRSCITPDLLCSPSLHPGTLGRRASHLALPPQCSESESRDLVAPTWNTLVSAPPALGA